MPRQRDGNTVPPRKERPRRPPAVPELRPHRHRRAGATPRRRMTFEILPSIDLRDGKVVDLYQGDFNRETVYSGSAADWAYRFLDTGTSWIHVVDLDGSRDGTRANRPLVEAVASIARERGAHVELGGGIRSIET